MIPSKSSVVLSGILMDSESQLFAQESSKCLAEPGAGFYTRLLDFCSDAGESAPYSVSDPHRAARQSVSGTWAGYIAAAVLVTAVLTAIAVVGIIYLLVHQNLIRGHLKF